MPSIGTMIRVWSGIPTALRLLKVNRKKKTNEKIRIVFICQLGHLWGCHQTIYEAALEDEMVEPYILAVPEYWEDAVDTGAAEYLEGLGYPVIRAFDTESRKFYDLQSLNPDYVFLPRPYDHYLPEQYRGDALSKYTKVCYLCYGYTCEDDHMIETCFTKYFTTNCYMIFPENDSTRAFSYTQHPISARLGIRHIIQTPFPRFDLMNRYKNVEAKHWLKPREDVNKRVIWTPRWTLTEELGASSFFKYKEFMFDFAAKHVDSEFLLRPHPLAFDNFLKTGKMTAEEIDAYKQKCQDMPNVQLDRRKEYLDSFATADILVSDLSGVVVDFAVTGKPIIYCTPEQKFNKSCEKLKDSYYVVHNQQELEETLEMLIAGQDPKKEDRERAVKEVLGTCDGKNGWRILQYIKTDCENCGKYTKR